MPESGKNVLIAYHNEIGKLRVTIGFYASRFTEECLGEDFDYEEDYSEEKDEFYIKEGWYDCSFESEYRYDIKNVTNWMPMARHPLNL